MKTQQQFTTTGLNTLGLSSNIIVAGVIFSAISPWWLILGVSLGLLSMGFELHQKYTM